MGAMKHLAMAKDHYNDLVSDDQEGYALLDHGSRSADELNADVIREAHAAGWSNDDGRRASNVLARYGREISLASYPSTWAMSPDVSEALTDSADLAEAWLNDHVAPEGYYFGNDGDMGCFGLWKVEDE